MQLLPYYIPPVVIANLINMVFFFFLLGAVEFFPMMTGLFQRTTRTNPIFTKPTSSVVETTELEVLQLITYKSSLRFLRNVMSV